MVGRNLECFSSHGLTLLRYALAIISNIRVGCKWLEVLNTLAYNSASLIVQEPYSQHFIFFITYKWTKVLHFNKRIMTTYNGFSL
jgi:hypothetical protein